MYIVAIFAGRNYCDSSVLDTIKVILGLATGLSDVESNRVSDVIRHVFLVPCTTALRVV